MSSEVPKPPFRSLSASLAAWFTLLFLAAGTLLFSILYWRLTDTIESRERSALERRLDQLVDVYLSRGLNGLRNEVDRETPGAFQTGSFVRIKTVFNEVTLARVPDDWIQLQQAIVSLPGGWTKRSAPVQVLRLPRDAERDFMLAARQLEDGSVLHLGRVTENRAALFRPLRRTFAFTGALLILIAGISGLLLARRATLPIREVSATARRILQTGNLSERVPVPHASGELAELTRHFNILLQRNETLIGSLRDALDNVAHDLRTPLTRLRMTAEQAIQNSPETSAFSREALADCIEESDRILKILNTLMQVSELESGAVHIQREPVDLTRLVAEVVELYSGVAEDKSITVRTALNEIPMVPGDFIRLRQAMANLLDNALKYTPSGGLIEISGETRPPGKITISIRDNGPGIEASEQSRIWDRLYRSERSRTERGLGLGLSLVKAMVEAHGGQVGVESRPGSGSRFFIVLPTAGDSTNRPPPRP